MTKKKLLFVIPNLGVGGAEKALVSLLNELDDQQYELDLFLFSHSGIFLQSLPHKVNLLKEDEYFKIFSKSFLTSILQFARKGKWKQVFNKIAFTISSRTTSN